MLFRPTWTLQRCSYRSSGELAISPHLAHLHSIRSSPRELTLGRRGRPYDEDEDAVAEESSGVMGWTCGGEAEEENKFDDG